MHVGGGSRRVVGGRMRVGGDNGVGSRGGGRVRNCVCGVERTCVTKVSTDTTGRKLRHTGEEITCFVFVFFVEGATVVVSGQV